MEKTLDTLRVEAEIAKLFTEAVKFNAETSKLNAEARKLGREHAWYPWVALLAGFAAAFTAGVTLAKLFV